MDYAGARKRVGNMPMDQHCADHGVFIVENLPGQKVGSHICEQTVYNVFFHQLVKTSLADQGFNLHSLRHAFGLHLYESGSDLFSIKEAMGHKSLSSTEVYLTLGIGNGRSVKSPYDYD